MEGKDAEVEQIAGPLVTLFVKLNYLTIMHLETFHSITEETEAEIPEEVPAMKAKEVLYCGGA